MARTCGDCSECCNILHVAQLSKPANQWCKFIAAGGGCGIYEERFEICRGYRCLWLLDDGLDDEWQPRRCGFIMHRVENNVGLWINVDATQPKAWKQQPFYARIKQWSEAAVDGSGFVGVTVSDSSIIVFPEEDIEIPGVLQNTSLKVGYRHTKLYKQPLVMVRNLIGAVTEHLGTPILT